MKRLQERKKEGRKERRNEGTKGGIVGDRDKIDMRFCGDVREEQNRVLEKGTGKGNRSARRVGTACARIGVQIPCRLLYYTGSRLRHSACAWYGLWMYCTVQGAKTVIHGADSYNGECKYFVC